MLFDTSAEIFFIKATITTTNSLMTFLQVNPGELPPDQSKIHITHCLTFIITMSLFMCYQFNPSFIVSASDARKCKHFIVSNLLPSLLRSTSRSNVFYLINQTSYPVTLILSFLKCAHTIIYSFYTAIIQLPSYVHRGVLS